MAYYIPLRTLKIGPDFAIPIHTIRLIGSIDSYNMTQLVTRHKKDKTLISATGKMKTRSVIILDNGCVITSPYSISTLNTLINRMQTYDMKDNEIRTAKDKKEYDKYEIDVNGIMEELGIEMSDEDGEGEEEEFAEETEDN